MLLACVGLDALEAEGFYPHLQRPHDNIIGVQREAVKDAAAPVGQLRKALGEVHRDRILGAADGGPARERTDAGQPLGSSAHGTAAVATPR